MAPVRSFAPASAPDARVLVLGSMPGERSLAAGQYYAHPQNAFWRVFGAILGFDVDVAYEHRLAALRAGGIALWDVLAACERAGSLDSAIDLRSATPNAFAPFFAAHRGIERVLCNGGTAHGLFVRRVLPTLTQPLQVLRMPSTSPAHAGMTFADKLAAWRTAVGAAPGPNHHS